MYFTYIMEKKILEIRQKLMTGVSKEELKKEYPEMAKKEKFFDMVTDKNMDEEILTALIVLREGVDKGEYTDEDASVLFGELLAKKYIPENLK